MGSAADDDLNPAYENRLFIMAGKAMWIWRMSTTADLDYILKLQKNHRTPGPDICPADFLKVARQRH